MGFDEVFIDITWRIISNNWYSIIINGKRYGFFHSKRGLKARWPPLLGPIYLRCWGALRSLNRFHKTIFPWFLYGKRGPQTNHQSFADNIIIFTSGRKHSLKLIMKTLATYDQTSEQFINKAKSHFLLPSNAFRTTSDRIKNIHVFTKKKLQLLILDAHFLLEDQELFISQNKSIKWLTESHVGSQKW